MLYLGCPPGLAYPFIFYRGLPVHACANHAVGPTQESAGKADGSEKPARCALPPERTIVLVLGPADFAPGVFMVAHLLAGITVVHTTARPRLKGAPLRAIVPAVIKARTKTLPA